jgi:uncharacterized membrane protein YjjP (DUF1212 family)
MEKVLKNEKDVLQLLNIAIETGRILIENGAEVYRVEDTLERICNSWYGLDAVEVFAMTTSVFVTVKFQGYPYTEIVREKNPSIRLNKIELINQFSREFCSTNMSLKEAEKEIRKINETIPTSLFIRSLGAGVTSAFFSIMFGGNYLDFLSSLLIGLLVYWILNLPRNFFIPIFIVDLLSGLLSSALATIFISMGFGANLDMIIIGTLMPYVPGVAITNAIRDILAGDYVSGVMTTAKAIFTAIAIALGVGIVLAIYFGGYGWII